jgi:hypothetical protein
MYGRISNTEEQEEEEKPHETHRYNTILISTIHCDSQKLLKTGNTQAR